MGVGDEHGALGWTVGYVSVRISARMRRENMMLIIQKRNLLSSLSCMGLK